MTRDFDDQYERDLEREPSRAPRRIALDPRGTLARSVIAGGVSRHGAECHCRWCVEQPESEAALDVLRRGGLL